MHHAPRRAASPHTAAAFALIASVGVAVDVFGPAATPVSAAEHVTDDVSDVLTPGVIYGTPDADVIVGTSAAEVICALGGDDEVDGGGGADIIFGGPGADVLRGGTDSDTISGGDGDDEIDAGNGDDTVDGGDGDDTIILGRGADIASAGPGDDHVDTGPGDDFAYGDRGDDELIGDNGADTLIGGAGRDDRADGGRGSDTCSAETSVGCEQDARGPNRIDELPFPSSPEPIAFEVDADGLDGVSLTIQTEGGLYPWDVAVRPAFTTPAMNRVVVSAIVDLDVDEAAPEFDSATLTLSYDETLVDTHSAGVLFRLSIQ